MQEVLLAGRLVSQDSEAEVLIERAESYSELLRVLLGSGQVLTRDQAQELTVVHESVLAALRSVSGHLGSSPSLVSRKAAVSAYLAGWQEPR